MNHKNIKTFLLIAFGLSGMAALIYEVVWIRPLALIFGASVYAFSVILAAFLTGFAIGSWAIRKYADKTKDPLRLFSLLELGIGIYGIVIIFIFRNLPVLDLGQMFQFSLIFALLIIPGSLMGATWPVVHKAFIKKHENVGEGVGNLYSVNSLGSMAGSILAGFLLIPFLGVLKTSLFAALINILVAFGLFVFIYLKSRK